MELINNCCIKHMKGMESESVHLTVTSPPYYNAREYSQYESYEKYLDFLSECFTEVFRVTKAGRMCVVNISTVIEPRSGRNAESQRLAIPFHFVVLMERIGWKFLEDIIWVKPEGAAKNRNGGFFRHRTPVAYKPNVVNEYVFVFQKPAPFLIDKILKEYRKIGCDSSLVLGVYERSNIWHINPETSLSSKHSAPYPLELAHKCVQYYSFEGDVVFDPFLGSGTTGVAAKSIGRDFIGVEVDEQYFLTAQKRIQEAEK